VLEAFQAAAHGVYAQEEVEAATLAFIRHVLPHCEGSEDAFTLEEALRAAPRADEEEAEAAAARFAAWEMTAHIAKAAGARFRALLLLREAVAVLDNPAAYATARAALESAAAADVASQPRTLPLWWRAAHDEALLRGIWTLGYGNYGRVRDDPANAALFAQAVGVAPRPASRIKSNTKKQLKKQQLAPEEAAAALEEGLAEGMEKETSGGAELETAFPSSDTLTVRLKRLVTRVRRAGAAAGTRAWGGGGGAEEEEEEEEEAPRAKKARRAPPPPASGGVWIQKKKRPEVVRALMVCGPPTDERDWLRLAARMGEAQPSASLRQSAADCLGAAAEAAQVAPRGAYITLPPHFPACVSPPAAALSQARRSAARAAAASPPRSMISSPTPWRARWRGVWRSSADCARARTCWQRRPRPCRPSGGGPPSTTPRWCGACWRTGGAAGPRCGRTRVCRLRRRGSGRRTRCWRSAPRSWRRAKEERKKTRRRWRKCEAGSRRAVAIDLEQKDCRCVRVSQKKLVEMPDRRPDRGPIGPRGSEKNITLSIERGFEVRSNIKSTPARL